MEAPNHLTANENVTIYQMVLNRLPFLEDTEANQTLVSTFILEVMFELELCFKVDAEDPDPSNIGDETKYTFLQKTIIADIVAYYILLIKMISNTAGSGGESASAGKFLRRTKAGSVEVEWDQFDTKLGGMSMSGEAMMMLYKKSAMRKASKFGCIIDICDDCTVNVETETPFIPFKVITDPDCGCSGTRVPERDTWLKNG